jgi:hypothetical protein
MPIDQFDVSAALVRPCPKQRGKSTPKGKREEAE